MTHKQRLAASCRVALSALLHDPGELAEPDDLASDCKTLETQLDNGLDH